MSLTLRAQQYFGLREIEWTLPKGLCALVGPNGSGKTTLLNLPLFLRVAMENGIGAAAARSNGPEGVRHFDAPPRLPTTVGITVDDVEWSMKLFSTATAIEVEDSVRVGITDVFLREAFAPTFVYRGPVATPSGGPGLRAALATKTDDAKEFDPLVRALQQWQVFECQNYSLQQFRYGGSSSTVYDTRLNANGTNVFSVLRNWRDSRATRDRWEFVIQGLKDMLPDLFSDIEFKPAGQQLVASFVRPGQQAAIPQYLAPNGWLVALLHLCAVASAEPGSVVALDEPENALHPFAIRRLIEAVRERAAAQDLTVVMATHSPVVLNQFADEPEKLFVMEPGKPVLPCSLADLRDTEWLKNFALGDLYAHDEFGAPKSP